MPQQTVAIVAALPDHLLNFREQLMTEMVAAGHRVVAFAAKADLLDGVFRHDPARRLSEIGVEFRPIPMLRAQVSPAADLRLLNHLKRELRDLRPDVVFPYHTKPVIYGSLAARMAKVPHCCSMITGLSYGMRESNQKSASYRLMHFMYKAALSGNRRVIFQNEDDLKFFRERRLLRPDQETLVVNGSGVDLQHFQPMPLPPEPITFLMTARLIEPKGVLEYVEAARIVRRTFPQAQFHYLGPLEQHPSAISAEAVQGWVDEGVIDYKGATDDVRPFLAACHVFVLPSHGEGTPRTVLEAMAMGRPVITTDAAGCRQTIEAGKSGVLVPTRNPEALAVALESFIENSARIAPMGTEARKRAEAMYDVREVNRVMMQALYLGGE